MTAADVVPSGDELRRMRWARKAVGMDGTTRGGFRWPVGVGGWVAEDVSDGQRNGAPCGVGLHLGLTVAGLSSAHRLAESILLCVGYMPEDVVGEDLHKVRVERCWVMPGLNDSLLNVLRSGWGRGANLTGANLIGADLYGAYLSGADLSRADLSGADLSRADLSRADLSGADLTGAYLTGADLTGANLTGANLTGANLTGAYLSGAYLSGAYLSGAYLSGAYLSGAYLSGADLPAGWTAQRVRDAGGIV